MDNRIKLTDINNRTEGSVLATLWRNVLTETNMLPALDYFVDRYVNNSKGMESRVKAVKRKTKSTMMKNVTANDMTWKTFLDLMFNFLKVKRIVISIKLTHPGGNESVHSVTVNNAGDQDSPVSDIGPKKLVEDIIKVCAAGEEEDAKANANK